jgi:hypothetical protein
LGNEKTNGGFMFDSTDDGRKVTKKTTTRQTQNAANIDHILKGFGQCLKAFRGTAAMSDTTAKYLKTLTATL